MKSIWTVPLYSFVFIWSVNCIRTEPFDPQSAMSMISSVQIENFKEQYLPANLAHTNFTLEDAKRLLRKKCQKAGIQNPNIYEDIEKATVELLECGSNIANLTELLNEIETARPQGDLDLVFHKYCKKRPQAEECLRNFNAQLLPCLSVEERAQNAIMMRIVSSLLGFLCHKNGDPIAVFIAEEGPECIEMQKENIGNCMDATFSAYMPQNGRLDDAFNDLPELVLSSRQCIDLDDFEGCVLSYLEQCNEITPGNIIESMFKYVKNETKCDSNSRTKLKTESISGSGSFSSVKFSFYLSAGAGVLLNLSKFFL